MVEYKTITCTHANHNRPVNIIIGTICGYDYSEKGACTHIYCRGLVVFPVKESSEEIGVLINNLIDKEKEK